MLFWSTGKTRLSGKPAWDEATAAPRPEQGDTVPRLTAALSSLPDDVLTKDAGECVICLEELLQGDTIARLPCLCIYHKRYGAGLDGCEGTAAGRVAGGRQGAAQCGGDTLSSPQLYRFMV